MSSIRFLACMCASVCAWSAAPSLAAAGYAAPQAAPPSAQEAPPPPIPGGAAAERPSLNVDGEPLVPGALPKSTSPRARETWERTRRASLTGGERTAPITAFDLAVDLRYKASDAQTNDFKARYRFLAPAFVRATTEHKREQVRGPAGDFLIDPGTKETIPLVGRESAEDRRQLDETLAIARNFTALSNPSSLSIVRLTLLAEAPAAVPPKLAQRARELTWLEIVSPNFHLRAAPSRAKANTAPLFRVTLGIDPATSMIRFVSIAEDQATAQIDSNAVFIELAKYKTIDGYAVPHSILVYAVDDTRRPLAFKSEPGTDLVLESVNLRAALKPEDFLP